METVRAPKSEESISEYSIRSRNSEPEDIYGSGTVVNRAISRSETPLKHVSILVGTSNVLDLRKLANHWGGGATKFAR